MTRCILNRHLVTIAGVLVVVAVVVIGIVGVVVDFVVLVFARLRTFRVP